MTANKEERSVILYMNMTEKYIYDLDDFIFADQEYAVSER